LANFSGAGFWTVIDWEDWEKSRVHETEYPPTIEGEEANRAIAVNDGIQPFFG
jgi:hypothetical protein